MARKQKKKGKTPSNTIAKNRRASHDYHLGNRFDAGIVLTGTEVKSARLRQVSLQRSFVQSREGELWLVGANIAPYIHGGRDNHDPEQARKLLLHKREIKKILQELQTKGVTLIPIRIYLNKGWFKLEFAVATGKKQYDKREELKRRDAKRQVERALKRYK